MKRHWGMRLLLGALLAAALASVACRPQGAAKAQDLQVYWPLPAFSFSDQLGRTVTNEELQGKVIVANFIFTNCTEFCPTTISPRMRELQSRLRDEGLLGQRVMLLSFSVDPKNDTSEKLRAYAEAFHAQYPSWRFLTGPEQEMRRVLTEGLKIAFERTAQQIDHLHPDGKIEKHEYNVVHSNRFVLVDSKGRVRAFPDGVSDWDLEKLVADIRRLLE